MTNVYVPDAIPDKPSRTSASPSTDYFATIINVESRLLAKKLHEAAYVYALYGALDGLSLSYSMVKYSFDLICTNSNLSSNDMMHDWMMTPVGMAAAATEAITLISFSLMANVFSDNDKNAFKRYTAVLWPYCRDSLKSLKNAYKGVRGAAQVASLFSGQDLRFMILPVGVLLGALSIANRIWYRRMKDARKMHMDVNNVILESLQAKEFLDDETKQHYQATILTQRNEANVNTNKALLSQFYAGIVDGMYLYMGAMGLTALAPSIFIAMSVFCVIFTLTCIATRVYEEYDFQKKLHIRQCQIELAICAKELDTAFKNLIGISNSTTHPSDVHLHDQKQAFKKAEEKLNEFELKRGQLRSLINLSYTSAALSGLKNGLAAYGAIASVVFAIATVNAMLLAPFPPLFLISSVIAGMACLIGFMAHALIKNHAHLCEQESQQHLTHQSEHMKPQQKFSEFLKELKLRFKDSNRDVKDLKPEAIKEDIFNGMILDPSPQFFFQEWFEVARSFFSGVAKGQKSIDYTLNPLQEADERGHYHDTPFMLGLTVVSSAVYAAGLALRAHARGFGREQQGVLVPLKRPNPSRVAEQEKGDLTSSLSSPKPLVEESGVALEKPKPDSPRSTVNRITPASVSVLLKFSTFNNRKVHSSEHRGSPTATVDLSDKAQGLK